MKQILSIILCLLLLCALVLPVAATESTEPTATGNGLQQTDDGSRVMAIICLVMVLAGGVYLIYMFKRPRRK